MTLLTWVLGKKTSWQVSLPAKRIVCPSCDGCGTELMAGLKGVCISDDDLGDPDFREAYFGGDYDVHCSECKGENVVLTVDEEALTPKMRERYWAQKDQDWKDDAEARGERRLWGNG